jgi:hypothetical protein
MSYEIFEYHTLTKPAIKIIVIWGGITSLLTPFIWFQLYKRYISWNALKEISIASTLLTFLAIAYFTISLMKLYTSIRIAKALRGRQIPDISYTSDGNFLDDTRGNLCWIFWIECVCIFILYAINPESWTLISVGTLFVILSWKNMFLMQNVYKKAYAK